MAHEREREKERSSVKQTWQHCALRVLVAAQDRPTEGKVLALGCLFFSPFSPNLLLSFSLSLALSLFFPLRVSGVTRKTNGA